MVADRSRGEAERPRDVGDRAALGRRAEHVGFAIRQRARAGGQYGLGTTPAAVKAKYFELAERLDRAPAQGYDGTTFRTITAALLRADVVLPALAKLWHQLDVNEPPSSAAAASADPTTSRRVTSR